MNLLEIKDLKVHFPVRTGRFAGGRSVVKAVDGVTLTVKSNETLAIVGESGCGKSTMGNAVLGLVPVTFGSITFEGRDLATLKVSERRQIWREMQVVFQDPVSALNPRLTIEQSISEPLVIHHYPKAEIRTRVDEIMALVGLNKDQRDRRPGALSGGQRQRIGIARALYKKASVMVFDEATSALDNATEQSVMDAIEGLSSNLTILLIAHRLTTVRRCDTIIEMEHGRVVAQGTYEHLLDQSPSFRRMAGAM